MERTILEKIYNQIKTPYKYGAVMKLDGRMTDSPVVFKRNNKYYMSFISIDSEAKTGYQTHIAESDDLLHWKVIGNIFATIVVLGFFAVLVAGAAGVISPATTTQVVCPFAA